MRYVEKVDLPSCTLYLADCRDVLPELRCIDVLVSDPPYGINYQVSERKPRGGKLDSSKLYGTKKLPAIIGDDRPFDPAHLLAFPKVAIFGANHMEGLPAGGRWIVWDKRRDSAPDDHSDCELIWTNLPGADRIHRQKWRGIVREGEENTSKARKLHRNQKPVALLDYLLEQLGVEAGATVCDPYMGSGSTGVVAIRRGNPFIGIEVDPAHFRVAVARLRAESSAEGRKPDRASAGVGRPAGGAASDSERGAP